ncbi:chemotaxis protein CheB [candidate division KSB1 bacterium]|nr:chemotaxis protein CheB [candidate division KSB1 bacterium]MBL7095355.1 chemotaxis protein CheB [candidate division KSB1 bacterium]
MDYEVIVIGVSTGGMKALGEIIPELPLDFPSPIAIVQHLHPCSDDFLVTDLNERSKLTVKQADEKEKLKQGFVYFAPSNYHLLIENDKTFSLSVNDLVNFARPAIDVLFETAAEAFKEKTLGIVLTGANHDGSQGAKKIKEYGGLVIVQDPESAEADIMPRAAIEAAKVDFVLDLDKIVDFLLKKI